jgi:hypothetical protein
MANSLYDDYKERGFLPIHVIIEDGTADGKINWEDAYKWSTDWDNDGTVNAEPLEIPVIADFDDSLWNSYVQDCSVIGLPCVFTCHVTPQDQMFDQGLVTVDDTCSVPEGETMCTQCGYSDAHVRSVLDAILPPAWCGEATP